MKQIIRRIAATAIFSLCGLLSLTTAAEAATYTVDNTGDDATMTACTAAANDCSLRGAIISSNNAASVDTIEFDATVFATAQTISISTGVMPAITDNLTINGTGADKLTIQNGRGATINSRIFNINPPNKTVYLSGMKITGGNVTMGNGGGISMGGFNQFVTIDRCIITGNTTQFSGGGISASSGTLYLINSTVSNNTANGIDTGGNNSNGGGGIRSNGTMTITNSTISGNRVLSTSADNGGGIFVDAFNGTGTTITNSTITNNSVGGTTGGGGVRAATSVTMRNSIVAANVNNTSVPDVSGAFSSSGYNLIGNVGTASGFGATGDQTGSSAAPVNSRLDALANYGGITPTHRLQTGSPAIDKGSSSGSTTDQRGLARPYDNPSIANATGGDGTDIGAFEVQAAPTAASASLGGRVFVAKGRGLSNAVVYLTDTTGNTQMRRTNNFGYYRFDDVTAGQTVILSVASKRYQFVPQVITMMEESTDVNFFAAYKIIDGSF